MENSSETVGNRNSQLYICIYIYINACNKIRNIRKEKWSTTGDFVWQQKPMNIGNAGHNCSECNHSNAGNFEGEKRELSDFCFSSTSRIIKAAVLHTQLTAHLICRLLPQTHAHGEGKAIPLQAWSVPSGFTEAEVHRFQNNRLMKAVRFFSPTHRPPLPPRKYSWNSVV